MNTTRKYESNADEASAHIIATMDWRPATVRPELVRDMLQQTQLRPSFNAGDHIYVDCTLIAAARYAIEKQAQHNKDLAGALRSVMHAYEGLMVAYGYKLEDSASLRRANRLLAEIGGLYVANS